MRLVSFPSLLASLLVFAACCDAAVFGDALYRSVLSKIPGITFVTSTPSMTDDTTVYFTSFGWPSNRTAQQADYVSVPVATMALCLAVQPRGAINATKAPTMAEISDLLTGQSTGATWLRSDWTSTPLRVSKVYWAASVTSPLLGALSTWRGVPYTSTSVFPSAVILPTDTDVAQALADDPSAIGFMSLLAAAQTQTGCLSITTSTSSGGTSIVAPQLQASLASLITVSSSLSVTCPANAGCYPLLGAVVAHVRLRDRMSSCALDTSIQPVVYAFISSTSPTAALLNQFSMLLPPTDTQVATLQTLTTSTCMPDTTVVRGVGGVLRLTALNDWFYQYFTETNGTVFVNYTTLSADAALSAVQSGAADVASNAQLTAADHQTYPTLHSYPSLAASVAVVVNIGQAVTVSLPRCRITSIFNGTLQWWNDTSIQAVNPLLVMPQQRIDVVIRVDATEATDFFER